MTNIQDLHKLVWDFREEMGNDFPTPSVEDSIAFAFTEVAEAIDARLRENPAYKRRTEKEHNVEQELTQCAMMLLTSIPPSDFVTIRIDTFRPLARTWHLYDVGYICGELLKYGHFDFYNTLLAIKAIDALVNLSETLHVELDRMRAKHKRQRINSEARQELSDEHNIYIDHPERLVLADYTEGMGE